MRIEKDKCDNCGLETSDRFLEIGWIHIDTATPMQRIGFSFSLGRTESGAAQTAFFSERVLDFCHLPCMVSFFKKGIAERKEQIASERAS